MNCSKDDCRVSLDVLGEACKRFDWMTNYYHLLVETPQANLSKGMRRLSGVYTQRL